MSNLGGTWPKPLILRSVDVLTEAYCSRGGEECISEHGKNACEKLSGHCVVRRDGYYIMSAVCVTLSAALLVTFILPTIRRLQCGSGHCLVSFLVNTVGHRKVTREKRDEILELQLTVQRCRSRRGGSGCTAREREYEGRGQGAVEAVEDDHHDA